MFIIINVVGLDEVMEMVRSTAGRSVDADTPLLETGLDSLGAVELRNLIESAAGIDASKLPSALFNDYPTANELSRFITREASSNICADASLEVYHEGGIRTDVRCQRLSCSTHDHSCCQAGGSSRRCTTLYW